MVDISQTQQDLANQQQAELDRLSKQADQKSADAFQKSQQASGSSAEAYDQQKGYYEQLSQYYRQATRYATGEYNLNDITNWAETSASGQVAKWNAEKIEVNNQIAQGNTPVYFNNNPQSALLGFKTPTVELKIQPTTPKVIQENQAVVSNQVNKTYELPKELNYALPYQTRGTATDIQPTNPYPEKYNINQKESYALNNSYQYKTPTSGKIIPRGTVSEVMTVEGLKKIDTPQTIYYEKPTTPTVNEVINEIPVSIPKFIERLETGTINTGFAFIDTGTSISNYLNGQPNREVFSDVYGKELQKETGYTKLQPVNPLNQSTYGNTFIFSEPGVSDVYLTAGLVGAGEIGALGKAGIIPEDSFLVNTAKIGGKVVYTGLTGVQTVNTLDNPTPENIIGEGLLLTPLAIKGLGIKMNFEETEPKFEPIKKQIKETIEPMTDEQLVSRYKESEARTPRQTTTKDAFGNEIKIEKPINKKISDEELINRFKENEAKLPKKTIAKDMNGNEININKPVIKTISDEQLIEQYKFNEAKLPEGNRVVKDIYGNDLELNNKVKSISDKGFIKEFTEHQTIENIKNTVRTGKGNDLGFNDYKVLTERSNIQELSLRNFKGETLERPDVLKSFESFDKDFETYDKLISYDFEEGFLERQNKLANTRARGIKEISGDMDSDMKSNLPKELGEKSNFNGKIGEKSNFNGELGEKSNLPKKLGTKSNLPGFKDEFDFNKEDYSIKQVPEKTIDFYNVKKGSIIEEALENQRKIGAQARLDLKMNERLIDLNAKATPEEYANYLKGKGKILFEQVSKEKWKELGLPSDELGKYAPVKKGSISNLPETEAIILTREDIPTEIAKQRKIAHELGHYESRDTYDFKESEKNIPYEQRASERFANEYADKVLSEGGIKINQNNEISLKRFKEPKEPITKPKTYSIEKISDEMDRVRFKEETLKNLDKNQQTVLDIKKENIVDEALKNLEKFESDKQLAEENLKEVPTEYLIKEYEKGRTQKDFINSKKNYNKPSLIDEAIKENSRVNYNKISLVEEAKQSNSNNVFKELEDLRLEQIGKSKLFEPIESELEVEFKPKQIPVSEFEGQGTYERTGMIPIYIHNNKSNNAYNFRENLFESDINSIISNSAVSNVPKLIQPQSYNQPQIYGQPQDFAQPEAQIQPQPQRQEQPQKYKEDLTYENPPEETYYELYLPSYKKKKNINQLKKLYIAQVRRKGKFESIGEPTSKGEALKEGQRNVLNTLRATFRIVPTGNLGNVNDVDSYVNPKIFRHPKENSKMYQENTYVQKTSQEGGLKQGRLSSMGEIMEIKQSKNKYKEIII